MGRSRRCHRNPFLELAQELAFEAAAGASKELPEWPEQPLELPPRGAFLGGVRRPSCGVRPVASSLASPSPEVSLDVASFLATSLYQTTVRGEGDFLLQTGVEGRHLSICGPIVAAAETAGEAAGVSYCQSFPPRSAIIRAAAGKRCRSRCRESSATAGAVVQRRR